MKRLLFVIDSLNCGGAEKSLLSLLQFINYEQNSVDLLVFHRGGAFEKFTPPQVNMVSYNLHGTGLLDRFIKFLHQIRFSYRLRRKEKRHTAETHWMSMNRSIKPLRREYDIAIAYQQGLPTFYVATKVMAQKKIAWVNADVFAAGYDMEYCRQFYAKMDVVVPVSQKLQDLMGQRLPWIKDKLYCIYDIVNPDVIRQLANESIDGMPKHCDGEVSLVTVGRLSRPKNHILAVKTAKILKEKGLSFKWYFVGDGGMRRTIEEKISDLGLKENVILLGFQENPYPFILNADIYVQTSSFEGFGLTITEAKVLYKPIVSTNFDVIHDQIIDKHNGLIAEMNPEDLATKILELNNNKVLRESIVANLKQETNATTITEPIKFLKLIENS